MSKPEHKAETPSEAADADTTDADRARLRDLPCTCARLRRTARRMTQAYDQALRPSGLRLTQYSVIANVVRADGLSVTDLANRLTMDRTTLTRNLRPLEKAGFVRIEAGPDRRSRAVSVTAGGRRAYAKAVKLWQEAERRFRRNMGKEETADLARLLDQAANSAPFHTKLR